MATVFVIWYFVSHTLPSTNLNQAQSSYIQSSIAVKSSSSIINKVSSKSLVLFSSSSVVSNSSKSSSSKSNSLSSLSFPVLDNNLELVKQIKLIIDQPDPKIQEIIKSAKDQ